MMKFFYSLLILVMACLLGAGCGVHVNRRAVPLDSGRRLPENNYYYFLEAQLDKSRGNLDSAIEHLKKSLAADKPSLFLKKELVFAYLQNSDTDNALAMINEILKARPDDVSVLILAANIHYQRKETQAAADIYRQVLEKDPEREKIYLILGKIYFDNDQYDRAAEVYRRMTQQFPDSWDGYFFLGKVYQKQGDLNAAESNFEYCLTLQPDLLSPRFELINLYKKRVDQGNTVTVREGDTFSSLVRSAYGVYTKDLEKKVLKANPEIADINRLTAGQTVVLPDREKTTVGDYVEKIISLYQAILNDYPDNPAASLQLALYYKQQGRATAGRELLQSLGKASESDPRINQYVYQLLIDQERYDEAQYVLTEMLVGAPESSALHYLLGMVFDRKEDPRQAIVHLARVKEGTAYYTDAAIHIAYLYEETGDVDKTIELLEKMTQQDPKDINPLLFLSAVYERQKEYGKAEAVLRRGLEIEPQNVELLFRLGVIYDKTQRKDDAIAQMRRVLSLAPDYASALNYLGYTYAEQGKNLEEAKQLIERALAIKPDSGYITDSLGWVYFQQGNLGKAVELLEKAVSLEPEDPVLLEHLGDAYLKSGDRDKALEVYQRSLQHNQDSPQQIKEKIKTLAGPDAP